MHDLQKQTVKVEQVNVTQKPSFSPPIGVFGALFTSHLRGESGNGNGDLLSLQTNTAITQPLIDVAIGGCYQSQL